MQNLLVLLPVVLAVAAYVIMNQWSEESGKIKDCEGCVDKGFYWCDSDQKCVGSAYNKCSLATPRNKCVHKDLLEYSHHFVRPCMRGVENFTEARANQKPGCSGLACCGGCCGDGTCGENEDTNSCPEDCSKEESVIPQVMQQGSQTKLFGNLEMIARDTYHCDQGTTKCGGPGGLWNAKDRESAWLESLLERNKSGALPFKMPPPGAQAMDIGTGSGPDARNIARQAGYRVVGLDASKRALELAQEATSPELAELVEFTNYDFMGLPKPSYPIDFLFDATVYCALRHRYLAKLYAVWQRIFEPGHTLVMIQCWKDELDPESWPVRRSFDEMHGDLEPIFDILHTETCPKNAGREPAWCFYLRLKDAATREATMKRHLAAAIAKETLDVSGTSMFLPEAQTLLCLAESSGQQDKIDQAAELNASAKVAVQPTLVQGELGEVDGMRYFKMPR